MKKLVCAIVALAWAAAPALADPDKDESGHGYYTHERRAHKGEYKEEFWNGRCKVERKWERNGNYKEERKCRAPRYGDYPHQDADVVVQPPYVIIQPPPVVIR